MITLDSNEISFCPQGKGNHHEFTPPASEKPSNEKEFDKAIKPLLVGVLGGGAFLKLLGCTTGAQLFFGQNRSKKNKFGV